MIASSPNPPRRDRESEQDIRLVARDEFHKLMDRRFDNACKLIGVIIGVATFLVAVAGYLSR